MTCFDRKEQLEKQAEERRKLEEWKVENAKADERFNELLQTEQKKGLTKPCPKCQTPITKNGGCSHMYVPLLLCLILQNLLFSLIFDFVLQALHFLQHPL